MQVDDALTVLEPALGGPPQVSIEHQLITITGPAASLVFDRRCDPPEVVHPDGSLASGALAEAVRAVVEYLDVAARFAAMELTHPPERRRDIGFVIEVDDCLYGPIAQTAPEAVAVWRRVVRRLPDAAPRIRTVKPLSDA